MGCPVLLPLTTTIDIHPAVSFFFDTLDRLQFTSVGPSLLEGVPRYSQMKELPLTFFSTHWQ